MKTIMFGTLNLDSSCSNHMSENKNIFGAVAEAKGTIVFNTKSGVKYIRDVLLVPDLKEIC